MNVKFDRDRGLATVRQRREPWDLVVIGGGATGVAVALDAAGRGLATLLLERFDFGSGTSSRSTKLVHGGVRYLRQGNLRLVHDALRERSLLRNNAPQLVRDQPFVIPCANFWQCCFYGLGLKLYDLLAGRNSFGRSKLITARRAAALLPGIRADEIRGGVVYHDGQFDDTRLLIDMAQTAASYGATLINYAPVTGLVKNDPGHVVGVTATDTESEVSFEAPARCVINAAGPFCDQVRRLDDAQTTALVAASQGVHVVLPKEFFPGQSALIVPKTSDGRVIFIVPWHDHAVVGTTDTPIPEAIAEPSPQAEEIEFLLETAARYLERTPTRRDVLSVFTGIRPLVKDDRSSRTASLSRDHVLRVSPSGLLTITGGKWTTTRKMAEDGVDRALQVAALPPRVCRTESMAIHSWDVQRLAELERENAALAAPIHPQLTITHSQVVTATRHEMARTVEDVLARRTRALFLNANAAVEAAPRVARLMADELHRDAAWCQQQQDAFAELAKHYRPE